MRTQHDKLVRDRLPEILGRQGVAHLTRTAGSGMLAGLLLAKLDEEVAELRSAASDGAVLDELVDIVEVVRVLAGIHGVTAASFEERREAKAAERGSFMAGFILCWTEDVTPADSADARG
jgi:predicted house-cleaning noncanonical NTP pyrophosphatase (MazG superfamily)